MQSALNSKIDLTLNKNKDSGDEIKLENFEDFKKSQKKNLKKETLFNTIEETEKNINRKLTNNSFMKNKNNNKKEKEKEKEDVPKSKIKKNKNKNKIKNKINDKSKDENKINKQKKSKNSSKKKKIHKKNHKKEKINSKETNKNDKKNSDDENFQNSFIEKQSILTLEPIKNSKLLMLNDEYELNLAQTKIQFNPVDYLTSEYLELSEQASNRVSRFLLAFFIVLISSLLSFLLVKYSIDWATKSRSELNSINDRENREVLEEINKSHNLIRFN